MPKITYVPAFRTSDALFATSTNALISSNPVAPSYAVPTISRGVLSNSNTTVVAIQLISGIVCSIKCAVEMVEMYQKTKDKKQVIKILAKYGLVLVCIYAIPYIMLILTSFFG